MTPSLRPAATHLLGLLALGLAAGGCGIEHGFHENKDQEPEAAPDIDVSPQELTFPTLPFGESEVESFAIENIGTSDLEVSALRMEDAVGFTVLTDIFPLSLAPGEVATVEVLFEPTETEHTGTIWVLSDDREDPEVPVTLIGAAGTPELALTPEAFDFGELPVACSGGLDVTMTNVGTARLRVTGATQAGDGFSLESEPELPLELEPGESDVVRVRFLPTAVQGYAGELTVESTDPYGARIATQVGTGVGQELCLPVNEGGEADVDVSFTVEHKIADVAFLIDTTGSMGSLANAMGSEFSAIAASLAGFIPDITFGVATYDDYNYGGFGSGQDRPFILRQQQTSDVPQVQTVLNSIPLHGGEDGPESTMEALFQAATGIGYDQNCNGSYDPNTDVAPFIADVSDAFGGATTGRYDSTVTGTGTLGGFGFRDSALPIFIYATDADLRDPGAGFPSPNGCPGDATGSDVISAINDLNGRAIGIGVNMWGGSGPLAQMRNIAAGTDSYGDMNGDGSVEEAVVTWSGTSAAFRSTVVNAVQSLIDEAHFVEVRLDIYGDDLGVVQSISPESYTNVDSGDQVDFTVHVFGEVTEEPGDSVVALELVVVGVLDSGGEVTLDRKEMYVVVQGG